MTTSNIIVFTDLDGSLLDHNHYGFEEARPLLSFLNDLHIPLIINSSKTFEEITQLQRLMDLQTPFIVENGAAIIFPSPLNEEELQLNKEALQHKDNQLIKAFGKPRAELLCITNQIKQQHQFKYNGFSDMTVSQIASLTQLSSTEAQAANERDFSEPIQWLDTQSRLSKFNQLLEPHQLQLQAGGRFYHISGQYNKGAAMQWLVDHWNFRRDRAKTIIALGDSMNDVSMLNRSDYAIVIKNKGRHIDAQGKIKTIYSSLPGTSGWVETLAPLIKNLTRQEGTNHG
jgi:mannosyl-3-phosphoglycerate phosphatase family protein